MIVTLLCPMVAYKYMKGDKHSRWKGGRTKNSQGYILIYKPDHPFCDKRGYVREHRLIYEQHNNCILLPCIEIHHINGIKTDNRIENLQPITTSRHTSLEMTGNKYGKKDTSDRLCLICTKKTIIDKGGKEHWYHKGNNWICRNCYEKKRRIIRKMKVNQLQ